MSPLLRPAERVLPTLNQDGSRRLIRPRTYLGRYYWRRLVTAWVLIVLFCGLPFLRVAGKPAVLLDISARQFTFFGRTFLATDGALLMLLMLSIFVAIFLITAVLGRAWCGWACPQTVYMEFLFRPLEHLIEGGRAGVLKRDRKKFSGRRAIKNVVIALLAIALGNVLLSYFVGTDTLALWMVRSPLAHPTGFMVTGVTAALVTFDFAFFREQMCTVLCPYARLQSALLDKDSLVVGYDKKRGEMRRKRALRKGAPQGDCVDCGACQIACPTGIDIRDGLQLECIACAQCVDACDTIMARQGKPLGLIRYASQSELAGQPRKLWRPRTFIYPALLTVLLIGLFLSVRSQGSMDLTVLRGIGDPFVVDQDGIRNQLRIRVRNRSDEEQSCVVSLTQDDLTLIAPQNPFRVEPEALVTTPAFVVAPGKTLPGGELPIVVKVRCGELERSAPYKLLGPKPASGS
jgi:cytochrome c oxidase accessory protein FixG